MTLIALKRTNSLGRLNSLESISTSKYVKQKLTQKLLNMS